MAPQAQSRHAAPRPRSASLQARLAVRLLAVFVFAFFASGLATFLISQADDTEIPDESLLRNFESLRDYVREESDGVWSVDPAQLPAIVSFVLRWPDGSEIRRAGDAAMLSAIDRRGVPDGLANLPPGATNMSWWLDPASKNSYYLISRAVRIEGRRAILQVIQVLTPTDSGLYALVDEWLGEFVPVGIPLLIVLVAALTLSLRSALRPLENLRRRAARIGPHQTSLRLPLNDLPTELQQPVLAINSALDRLDRGFQAQRAFLADAAHELRTPLTILAAHLDTLPRQVATDTLKSDVARMTRLVNQLLLVAQLQSMTVDPKETTDLSEIAVDLAALFAPLAIRLHRDVGVSGAEQPVIVRGNKDAIHQALRNLVENALRFTPEGTEVEIAVDPAGSVTVADRGPGIPPQERHRLFERFWQGEYKKRDSRAGGAGLGLAIAHRIAETHQARLEIDDNPGGGAKFTLSLPLAA
ncbi:signal transduction histidine kinase [Dongia mobilis]|uniref:histidine kinase n=1 Tax=Dongia mobilis TaxID=578943 RepID=A0A4R6WSY5_9PROT|nr:HAMP domain-containing sensor histidine kinase [Dongia mobilis]TDQ85442.1 signal transduction histidine kinase [Dongia mobilis]